MRSIGAAPSRSMAGPHSTGCVAATCTDFAPCLRSRVAAAHTEPPVAMMSSIISTFFPSTSPMMKPGSVRSGRTRRLSTTASSAPSRTENGRASFTDPTSGLTTTRSGILLSRNGLASTAEALRWSTGMSKKPWICEACRSSARQRSAPATVMRFATSFAVIGTRPSSLRSLRA